MEARKERGIGMGDVFIGVMSGLAFLQANSLAAAAGFQLRQ
jgi:hypothetical protein